MQIDWRIKEIILDELVFISAQKYVRGYEKVASGKTNMGPSINDVADFWPF